MSSFVIAFLVIFAGVWLVYRVTGRRQKGAFSRVPVSRILCTRDGLLFVLFAAVVLLSALNTGVNLIYLTFSILTSAIGLSIFISVFAGTGWQAHCHCPSEVQVGDVFHLTLHVSNHSAWMPVYALTVSLKWPEGIEGEFGRCLILKLLPGQERTVTMRAVALRRGRFVVPELALGTSFPFGFFERQMRFPLPASFVAVPRKFEWLRVSRSTRSDGMELDRRHKTISNQIEEFFGLREYHPGDNPRWIHWRTSARLQRPMVREYGNHEVQTAQVILLSVLSDETLAHAKEQLETAICVAATLSTELCRQGFEVALSAFVPEPLHLSPARGARHEQRMLRELAILAPAMGLPSAESLPGLLKPRHSASIFLVSFGDTSQSLETILSSPHWRHSRLRRIHIPSPEFENEFYVPPLSTPRELFEAMRPEMGPKAPGADIPHEASAIAEVPVVTTPAGRGAK